MKKTYFTSVYAMLLVFMTCMAVSAQTKIKIVDAETQEPVEEVLVKWKNGQELSNNNGEVNVPSGITIISLSRVGFAELSVELQSLSPSGIIQFKRDPDLLPVVITAYPIRPETYSAPASYTFIPSERIQIANSVEYGDVLNNVPGVFMHTGTLGTNRITIRGIGARTPFSTNRIRAYYNEIPLTAGDGETSLEDNELSTLGNIEIIKGPSATSYGAGLAGLIKLSPQKSNESFISSTYGIGSFGLSRNNNIVQVASGEHFIKASYATTFAEGFRDNNQYDRDNITLNYRYNGKKVQVDFLTTYIDVKGFIPSSINETDFNENPSLAAGNWQAVRGFEDYIKGLIGTTVTAELTERQTISGTLYTTFRDNYELRPFGILTEKSNLFGTRWKYNNEISHVFRLAAGGEYSVENFDLTTLDQEDREPVVLTSFNQQRRRSLNLFVEGVLNPSSRLEIIGGLNLSRVNYDLLDLFREDGDQSGNYSFDAVLSPRLFLGYSISNNQSIYAQVSRGFSAPSVEETLTPDGQINTDIQPETGYNFEIGSRGNIGDSGFKYQLNAYVLSVRNLLVARRTAADQFIGINAGKTLHQGVEFELNYKKRLGKVVLSPFLNASISEITFNEFVDLEEDFSGNKLPGVPSFTGNLGVFVKSDFGVYANVNFRRIGEMFLRDDNILRSEAYSILNLKVGYQHQIGKILFDLNGGINNLTDETYASQILINAGSFGGRAPRYFYPGNPRNYYGNLQVRYAF